VSRQRELERPAEGEHQRAPGRSARTKRSLIDRLYFVGVSVKGADGLLELILGLALLGIPSLPHAVLEGAASRASSTTLPFGEFVSNYLENLDGTLAHWGTALVIAYLVAHGAIKVLLVICLLLRIHKVYPAAVAVLAAFLAYEIYLFCVKPGVTLGIFVALDALIIYLVIREYRQLKEERDQEISRTGSERVSTDGPHTRRLRPTRDGASHLRH
jgi:uncharacterized membrane protein